MNLDTDKSLAFVDRFWERSILPAMRDYIEIPCESPAFDPAWEETGHLQRAAELAAGWVEEQGVPGAAVEIIRLEGRTPLLLIDIPGETDGSVLLYGHLDKQPPMTGWADDLGPWKPVVRDGKLYGRGGADDGYAVFGAVAAALALKQQGVPHPRLLGLIECSEESGSPDLPPYIEAFAERIGQQDLIVCLDSGCGDYERLWVTTSLRGMALGDLAVSLLREGVHSGQGTGVAASSFRVARHLLSRLEDAATGEILPSALHVEIPAERLEQAHAAAAILGAEIAAAMPFHDGVAAVSDDPCELLLNNTWRPALAVTGQDGLPPLASAGNVLRPHTTLKLSLRLPPTLDPAAAAATLEEVLLAEPPYGARVSLGNVEALPGWNAPMMKPWLERSVDAASREAWGRGVAYTGEGGSIPFMNMLGERFPKAGFVITGILGPGSNAHGPNEFLHIDATKRLIAAVARIIADAGRNIGG